jgi:hypothetical protein|tara:strand:- start:124 stop:375 length:252 start_codon:yes stop_codon:yes gene_type:complete
MAVTVIVLAIIAIFSTGIAILSFQPALYDLAYKIDFWENPADVSQDILITRDTLYSASIAIPIFMVGIIVIWSYLAITRREEI